MNSNLPRRARGEIFRLNTRKPHTEGAFKHELQHKPSGSERPEQASPAHGAWMDDGIRIGIKSFANLSGLPSLLPDVERHIDHHRRSDNVVPRNAAPETAIVGIAAIVSHYKIAFVWNSEREASGRPARCGRVCNFR